MGRRHRERYDVYAILRFDAFHDPGTSVEVCVTVKEVVHDQKLAEAEVARLNSLAEGKGIRYWWSPTRLYPEGCSAGSQSA